MQSTETLRRHATLVDRMSQTVGVDLEEMILRGQLEVDGLGDAVLRCTGCTAPGTCEKWLNAQKAQVEAAPGFCRNGDLFDLLKSGQTA